jgi:hypothetical protein
VQIVYLDQNKWIELARAVKRPDENRALSTLVEHVAAAVRAGRLVLPLSATIIYETYKINSAQRRHDLAVLQATLSGGLVFRGRYKRLGEELCSVLRDAAGLVSVFRDDYWFLSRVFLEAYAEYDDPRLRGMISDRVFNLIQKYPADALYSHIATAPDEERIEAVSRFSAGSEQLRLRIEERRRRHVDEPLAMRRRIYSALIVIDEATLILQAARKSGTAWTTFSDMGGHVVRRLVRDVPTYYVERELALRLEAQARPARRKRFQRHAGFLRRASVCRSGNCRKPIREFGETSRPGRKIRYSNLHRCHGAE